MAWKPRKVPLTERQYDVLQAIIKQQTAEQSLVRRARIILTLFDGANVGRTAERIGCERHQVGMWKQRWTEHFERLVLIECGEEFDSLHNAIVELLSDQPRSGWGGKFSAEQVTQILAVACESPDKDSERPVTHWTPRELAEEVVRRGLVDSISPRHVGRFLKDGRLEATPQPVLAEPKVG